MSLTRSTTATGSSAGPLWKISVRTYVPSPRNVGRTETSPHRNSKGRGSKAARNSSILTARRMSKLSVNRIRAREAYCRKTDRRASPRPAFGQTGPLLLPNGIAHIGLEYPTTTKIEREGPTHGSQAVPRGSWAARVCPPSSSAFRGECQQRYC